MSIGLEEVMAALLPEEPDYEAAVQLGEEVLVHLQTLVDGADANLASKAAYLAGRIGVTRSAPVIDTAARSIDPSVRAAAAGGARFLNVVDAEPILLRLLDDDSPGVRKTALLSVPELPTLALEEKVASRRRVELQPGLRDLVENVHVRSVENRAQLRRNPLDGTDIDVFRLGNLNLPDEAEGGGGGDA